jgi:hypothetical protein
MPHALPHHGKSAEFVKAHIDKTARLPPVFHLFRSYSQNFTALEVASPA